MALGKLDKSAEPALRKALDSKPSLEVQRRIRALLEALDSWPGLPLQSCGAGRLERIGNADARQVLTALAQGDPNARLTQEARASLQHLRCQRPKQVNP